MAITFPRELPSYHMSECWIDLSENVSAVPSGKGNRINLSQINDPLWNGTFLTGILQTDVQAVWSAWRKSLRGGLKTFIAYDVRRKTPYAYPNAKVPADVEAGWDGLAGVTSLGLSGALGLSGLPASYQAKVGDRIGLTQNSNYGYYEVLEDATANLSGAMTVNVTPFLHTGLFTTSAVARLWQPRCQFIIDPSSWSEDGSKEPTPVSFRGYQKL